MSDDIHELLAQAMRPLLDPSWIAGPVSEALVNETENQTRVYKLIARDDFGGDRFHDAEVDVEQIVPAHARFSRHTGGDHDHIGIRGV